MTEPASALSLRAAWSRAILGVLLVLTGLVAPQLGVSPAYATPTALVDDAVLRAELTADVEAYLEVRGAAEHVSAAGVSVSLADRRSSIDVSAGTMTYGGTEPVRESGLIIAIGLNSRTVDDQATALALAVHDTLVEHGVVPAPSAPVGAAA